MLDGILDAAFLQAACAHVATPVEPDGIVLQVIENASLYIELTAPGEVVIKSVNNGEPEIRTYYNPNEEDVDIEVDANTDIQIIGDLPSFTLGPGAVNKLKVFRAINSPIRTAQIGNQNNVEILCLPSTLTTAPTGSFLGVTTIKYSGSVEDIATKVASIIESATSADGVVYADSYAPYYSLIENAAENKGWTVEQI